MRLFVCRRALALEAVNYSVVWFGRGHLAVLSVVVWWQKLDYCAGAV